MSDSSGPFLDRAASGFVWCASCTHREPMRQILLGFLALSLLGVLVWIVSQNGAINLRDPRGPLFGGPLPTPQLTAEGAAVSPPETPGRFTVVSFNVLFGYEAKSIASTLRANGMERADVVLLQESNREAATRTAADLGMAFAYYPAAVHPRSRDLFGVAILSRWPIVAHRKIMLPDKSVVDSARKVAMATVVEIQGVPIRIVSVHLQSGMVGAGFKRQVKSLMECAMENDCHNDHSPSPLPAARATVVGGDFNTWVGTLRGPLDRRMSKYGLARVQGIKGTFSKPAGAEPKSKHTFDYFFGTREIIAGPGRVGKDRTGSDHFPIAAEFLLPLI
jgi:endonuclease/exonuclease/phosphatase family metal-dependent hydrolase